ncbi:MAG: response regulator transcription factor [bacterium]
MRLLLIEDQIKIGAPLKKALERRMYAVDYCLDGVEGYKEATINKYDCIILDLSLPGMDGLEISRTLRSHNNQVPILMLTARGEQEDVIEGFESGADDYLRKPFSLQELLLRINALIRRSKPIKEDVLVLDDLLVNAAQKRVFKNDKEIVLNMKEYGILEYLLRNKGRTISQEELLEHVWNREIDTFTQTVRTNIKTLRKKIDSKKKIIKTIKGSGYAIF